MSNYYKIFTCAYLCGLSWKQESTGPNGKTNRDCQLLIGREMLREPLLKSDEYLSCNGHSDYKDIKIINKLLTLSKFLSRNKSG